MSDHSNNEQRGISSMNHLPCADMVNTPVIMSPRRSRNRSTSSSDLNDLCAICYDRIKKSSNTNSCDHKFCFKCLRSWGSVNAVCPLCKRPFSVIKYDNKATGKVEIHEIPQQEQSLISSSVFPLPSDSHYSVFPEFGVRIPSSLDLNFQNPSLTSTLEFRRNIYRQNCYSVPLYDRISARPRDVSAQFYRENPAQIHRLIPWLNRELIALFNNNVNIHFLLGRIENLLTQYDMTSHQFRRIIRNLLYNQRSHHFLHEFINFARSPYDMHGYDHNVTYTVNPPVEVSDDSSSDDNENHPPGIRSSSNRVSRQEVYERNLYAYNLVTPRKLEMSASFYRTHKHHQDRIKEWLDREIEALIRVLHIDETRKSSIVFSIMSWLVCYDLLSRHFRQHVHHYFNDKTSHFIHELKTFAQTMYSMKEYDRHVQYPNQLPTPVTRPQENPVAATSTAVGPAILLTDSEEDAEIEVVNSSPKPTATISTPSTESTTITSNSETNSNSTASSNNLLRELNTNSEHHKSDIKIENCNGECSDGNPGPSGVSSGSCNSQDQPPPLAIISHTNDVKGIFESTLPDEDSSSQEIFNLRYSERPSANEVDCKPNLHFFPTSLINNERTETVTTASTMTEMFPCALRNVNGFPNTDSTVTTEQQNTEQTTQSVTIEISDSSESDDCQYVKSIKPPHLRTPECFDLVEDSSDVTFVDEKRDTVIQKDHAVAGPSGLNKIKPKNIVDSDDDSESRSPVPKRRKRNKIIHSDDSDSSDSEFLPYSVRVSTKKKAKKPRKITKKNNESVLNTSVECNEAISNARADTLGETIPQRIKAKDPVLHAREKKGLVDELLTAASQKLLQLIQTDDINSKRAEKSKRLSDRFHDDWLSSPMESPLPNIPPDYISDTEIREEINMPDLNLEPSNEFTRMTLGEVFSSSGNSNSSEASTDYRTRYKNLRTQREQQLANQRNHSTDEEDMVMENTKRKKRGRKNK